MATAKRRPEPGRGPKKIALLGSAPSSRLLAPFDDPDWTIWACSLGNFDALPRVDTWFELHSLGRKARAERGPAYLDMLAKHPSVYLQYEHPAFPRAMAYPKDDIVEKYGAYFLTSSIAWMMALAIETEPEAIGVWGADMSTDHEYAHQRAGCHYFIQVARRRGIEIVVPPESDLLQAPALYGYRESSPMWRKLMTRKVEVQRRADAMAEKRLDLERNEHILRGALNDLDYMLNTWTGLENEG